MLPLILHPLFVYQRLILQLGQMIATFGTVRDSVRWPLLHDSVASLLDMFGDVGGGI
jgi:hypothetical protein